MAYGPGADEKLCKQFLKVCRLSGSEDETIMDRKCSRNIRKFFWDELSEFEGIDLKKCEENVFTRLAHKKKHICDTNTCTTMAYGPGADEKLCKQFLKVCRLSGSEDETIMDRKCSRNIRKFFWDELSEFEGIDLKKCEENVFTRLAHKKKQNILVDGAHVEAYLTEMAHEITKLKRDNPKLTREDPRVTLTKDLLEKIVRETKIMIGGKIILPEDLIIPDKNRSLDNMQYQFVKPEFPKAMKKVYDLRKAKPIVIAKRDYGNLTST